MQIFTKILHVYFLSKPAKISKYECLAEITVTSLFFHSQTFNITNTEFSIHFVHVTDKFCSFNDIAIDSFSK